ncbi:GNAT family N-acetyltransferase [Microbacteriaceae bacterium 4G12]
MHFPVLETKRLVLREITKNDAPSMFQYFSRDDAMKCYGMNTFKDLSQAEALAENFQRAFEEKRGIRWGIVTKENDEFIGTIGFHAWSVPHKRAEIGYEIHPNHWRKGYAQEALQAAIAYGFGEWDLNRISAVVFIENTPSHKVLQNNGFTQEGVLREYIYQNDIANDVMSYSLLRREWEANKGERI